MGNLTVKQDGTGDYTTLAGALGDAGLTSGDIITITGTWTIADTAACTAADSGITITADADAAHAGVVTLQGGTGGSPTAAGHYRLEVNSGTSHCITVNQPCTIQKIVIRQNGTGTSAEGIRCAADVTVEQCILYGNDGQADDQDGLYTTTAGVDITLRNSMVYGWNRAGLHLQYLAISSTNTTTVDSCTFWDCGHADNSTGSRGIGGIACITNEGTTSLTFNIDNTIVIDCAANSSGDDYNDNSSAGTRTWNINSSIDSDNSISVVLDSGSGNLASRSFVETGSGANQVVVQDITSAPYDLRLVDDTTNNDAQDAGATGLTVDIAGTARPQNSTDDIGAFEVVAGGAPTGQPFRKRLGGIPYNGFQSSGMW